MTLSSLKQFTIETSWKEDKQGFILLELQLENAFTFFNYITCFGQNKTSEDVLNYNENNL